MIQSLPRLAAMEWINQYSFLLLGAFLLVALSLVLFRDGIRQNDLVAVGSLLLGLVFAYVLFRPSASAEGDPASSLDRIGGGVPVLLELQSPY
jgi:hypothetical protein